MVKIIFLVVCIVLMFGESSMAATIECDYNNNVDYYVLGKIYHCIVKNNPNIISDESAVISGINGQHQGSKTNNDVFGFRAHSKTIQVFPKGLEKFFKNIKLINIEKCQLKEIHQNDLKAFPHLVFFGLFYNEIEVIEEGLFDFNPNLELVGFYESKIIHIDSNVFDNLSKLSYFYFENVPCINKDIKNSRTEVLEAIKVVKSKCSNSEFLSLDSQIKNLEIESKTLNSLSFIRKLDDFEETFKNSKFSKFRPLNYKFEDLLQSEKCSNCRQMLKIASVDKKLTDVAKDIKDGQNKIGQNFENLKLTQCGLKSPFMDLKSSQSSIQSTVNALKSMNDDQGTKLDQIQNVQTQLKDSMSSSFNNVLNKVSEVSSTQGTLKTYFSKIESQVSGIKSSQGSSFNNLESLVKSEAGQIKTSQNEAQNVLNVINSQLKSHRDELDILKNIQAETNLGIDKLKSSFNDVSSTLANIQDSNSKCTASHNTSISDLKNVMLAQKSLYMQNNEIKLSQSSLSSSVASLNNRVTSLEASLKELKESQEKFDNSFETIKKSQISIQRSLQDILNQLESS